MLANAIPIDKNIRKEDQHIRYKLHQWKKIGPFDILNNISKYVTLVQLMDSVGNINHAVSVVGKWTFDSNYKKVLPLNIDSLNLICAFSDEYYYLEIFQVVYYAVRSVNTKSISKHVQNLFDIIMHIIYI